MRSQFENENNIDDIFRRELRDHLVTPPKDTWGKVNSRLRVKNPIPYYIAAAVVVGALLVTGWWGVNHQSPAASKNLATGKNNVVKGSSTLATNLTKTNIRSRSSQANTVIGAANTGQIESLSNRSSKSNSSVNKQQVASTVSSPIAANSSPNLVNEADAKPDQVSYETQQEIVQLQALPSKSIAYIPLSKLSESDYADASLSKTPNPIVTLSSKSIKGFYAGVNGSVKNVWIIDHYALNAVNFKYKITPGFAYGVQGGYNFSDNFGLEAGLTLNARDGQNYTLYLANVTPEDKSVVLNYMEVPVIAKFKIPQLALSGMPIVLNINVGASYGYLRSAYTFEGGDKTGSEYQYPTNQLNALAGFNYDIYTHHSYSLSFGFMAEYALNTTNNEGNQISAAAAPVSQFPNGSDFGKPHNLSLGVTAAINYNFSLFHN